MASFLENIKKTLQIGIDKTEEYGKIGKIKVDIVAIKNKMDKLLRSLGDEAYQNLTSVQKDDLLKNIRIKQLIKEISDCKMQIQDKEKKIDSIRNQYEAKQKDIVKKKPEQTKPESIPASAKKAPAKKVTPKKPTPKKTQSS